MIEFIQIKTCQKYIHNNGRKDNEIREFKIEHKRKIQHQILSKDNPKRKINIISLFSLESLQKKLQKPQKEMEVPTTDKPRRGQREETWKIKQENITDIHINLSEITLIYQRSIY